MRVSLQTSASTDTLNRERGALTFRSPSFHLHVQSGGRFYEQGHHPANLTDPTVLLAPLQFESTRLAPGSPSSFLAPANSLTLGVKGQALHLSQQRINIGQRARIAWAGEARGEEIGGRHQWRGGLVSHLGRR